MSVEIIKAIALLCQMGVSTGNEYTTRYSDEKQLACQQHYVQCVEATAGKLVDESDLLTKCIKERKQ